MLNWPEEGCDREFETTPSLACRVAHINGGQAMKVQVLLTLDVDDCDPEETTTSPADKKRATAEAIHNAVQYAQGEGHVHELQDVLSIMLDKVEVFHIDGFRHPANIV
jgi:hypothetical protein